MPSSHFVAFRYLALLRYVNTHKHINPGRQLVPGFSSKYFYINYDAAFTVRHFEGIVPDFAGFFAKYGTQKPLFGTKFCFSLGGYLTYQDLSGPYLGANPDYSPVVQIFHLILADIGNISCDLLGTQFCISGVTFIFFNVNRSVDVFFHEFS